MVRIKIRYVSWLVGRLFWKLVLNKWFTGMHSAGKPMSGHTVIEKAKLLVRTEASIGAV